MKNFLKKTLYGVGGSVAAGFAAALAGVTFVPPEGLHPLAAYGLVIASGAVGTGLSGVLSRLAVKAQNAAR